MVWWSLAQAVTEGHAFAETLVLVSTNDPAVAEVAARWSGSVPVLTITRPAYLCEDTALTDPAMVHALHEAARLRNFEADVAVLLQPTSPLRPANVIERCVRRTMDYDCDSALTVHRGHFVWHETFDGTEWTAHCSSASRPRRQVICREDTRWIENGNCYATKAPLLLQSERRLAGRVGMVEIPKVYGMEVDEESDLWLIEEAFRHVSDRV